MSGAAVKGRGRRSPGSVARTTSIPYGMNRIWFFIPVTITLLSRAKAAAFQSARWVPPVAMPLEFRFGEIGHEMVLELAGGFEVARAAMRALPGADVIFDEDGAGRGLGSEPGC